MSGLPVTGLDLSNHGWEDRSYMYYWSQVGGRRGDPSPRDLPSWVSYFALHWWDRRDGVAIAYQETLAVARITDSQISVCGILSGYAHVSIAVIPAAQQYSSWSCYKEVCRFVQILSTGCSTTFPWDQGTQEFLSTMTTMHLSQVITDSYSWCYFKSGIHLGAYLWWSGSVGFFLHSIIMDWILPSDNEDTKFWKMSPGYLVDPASFSTDWVWEISKQTGGWFCSAPSLLTTGTEKHLTGSPLNSFSLPSKSCEGLLCTKELEEIKSEQIMVEIHRMQMQPEWVKAKGWTIKAIKVTKFNCFSIFTVSKEYWPLSFRERWASR